MRLFCKIWLFSVVMVLYCNFALAANITVEDCAIGGVKAGWHSSHHYLPEKFNKTALKDAEWKKSKTRFELDNYPKQFILGLQNVPMERLSKDGTIAIFAALTERSREAGNLYQAIFEKSNLYIAMIAIQNSNNVDQSYELLASNMQTPRGIHLGSTEQEIRAHYGEPDMINQGNGGVIREYFFTPETVLKRKKNKNYLGAGVIFFIQGGKVSAISVHNIYGY